MLDSRIVLCFDLEVFVNNIYSVSEAKGTSATADRWARNAEFTDWSRKKADLISPSA